MPVQCRNFQNLKIISLLLKLTSQMQRWTGFRLECVFICFSKYRFSIKSMNICSMAFWWSKHTQITLLVIGQVLSKLTQYYKLNWSRKVVLTQLSPWATSDNQSEDRVFLPRSDETSDPPKWKCCFLLHWFCRSWNDSLHFIGSQIIYTILMEF